MQNIFFSHCPKTPEELWRSFVMGDMQSFRKIYQRYYQFLFDFGIKHLSTSETEDCLQNLFLYLLEHRTTISNIKDVKSYLFISYRNIIFKYLKKSRQFEALKDEDFEWMDGEENNLETLLNDLVKLLQKLSPREHQIINMKYYQGFKNMEIATLLDLDYQTVRNTLGNALKKMRLASL